MANEHSIRVSARGEFGQLERGLKNLQKDLNSVLGEIDKGARRGGVFDESQLRALNLYRARFKETMGELDREFQKQNGVIDSLHKKRNQASADEQKNIDREIRAREKQLDVIRRQITEIERLNQRREQEASAYETQAPGATQTPTTTGGTRVDRRHEPSTGTRAIMSGLQNGAGSLMGAGKFALGLAGINGIMSMVAESYQKAYESQVTPLDLSQRLRGNGYYGSAKDMWDYMGEMGMRDKMGYTSAESWQFQDHYSRQAGALEPGDFEHLLKFGRAYGLQTSEVAQGVGQAVQQGSVSDPSDFADMIAKSADSSGMTTRMVELMQVNNTLTAQMSTSLKDTGAKQILAYQTTLDRIGQEQGMEKLRGQEGANVIQGLGGIFNPNQENNWKWMGIQALQEYDPKKYGDMSLYGLEKNFEDGLMNPDNLPAMSKYLKNASGGDVDLEKRMLQRWLQDGGYNATKGQVDDLYKATDGLTAFDEKKIEGIMKELDNGDGTAKYQERMTQLGQNILDVDARFEKQLENLGQPLLALMTDVKGGITDILEAINDGSAMDTVEEIVSEGFDWLKEHWKDIATAGAIASLAKAIVERLPKDRDGKGKKGGGYIGDDDDDDDRKKKKGMGASDDEDERDGGKNGKKPKIPGLPPIIPPPVKGAAKGWGLFSLASGAYQTAQENDKERHAKWAENAGLNPDDVTGFDRFATNTLSTLVPFFDQQDAYNMFSPDVWKDAGKDFDKLMGNIIPSWNVPRTKEQQESFDKLAQESAENPSTMGQINRSITDMFRVALGQDRMYTEDQKLWGTTEDDPGKGWMASFEGMRKDFFDGFIQPMNDAFGWDIGGQKRDSAVSSLTKLGNDGSVSINGLSLHGQEQLQKLADAGLVKFEEIKGAGTTTLTELSSEGRGKLQELADNGIIEITGLNSNGQLQIMSLSSEGKARIAELKDQGVLTFQEWNTGTQTTLTGFTEEGKARLAKLEEQGLISIGGFTEDGKAQLTVLSDEGRTKLENLREKGLIDIGKFKEDGTVRITELSEKGAEELLNLQKNGSLSMDGMKTNTDKKMKEIKKDTGDKLGEIKGEHVAWRDAVELIFAGWAENFKTSWEGFLTWWKDLMPDWMPGGGDDEGGGGALSGNSNAEKAFNFLKDKGYSDAAASAVVGNFMQESKMNPTARNDSSGAFGIGQWLGDRLTGLKKFAKDNGMDYKSLDTQLLYFDYETKHAEKNSMNKFYKTGWSGFKKAEDQDKAVVSFRKGYERPGAHEANDSARKGYANDARESFAGGVGRSGGKYDGFTGGGTLGKFNSKAYDYAGKPSGKTGWRAPEYEGKLPSPKISTTGKVAGVKGKGKHGMTEYTSAMYDMVTKRFPNSKNNFMGGYVNRNVRGGKEKSMHAYGRAFDIGGTHAEMSQIAEFVRTLPEVQYTIYNRRISRFGGVWDKYDGQNPHTDHVHVDFKYKQGTPHVPSDQVALLHEGEAVIPKEFNPNRFADGVNPSKYKKMNSREMLEMMSPKASEVNIEGIGNAMPAASVGKEHEELMSTLERLFAYAMERTKSLFNFFEDLMDGLPNLQREATVETEPTSTGTDASEVSERVKERELRWFNETNRARENSFRSKRENEFELHWFNDLERVFSTDFEREKEKETEGKEVNNQRETIIAGKEIKAERLVLGGQERIQSSLPKQERLQQNLTQADPLLRLFERISSEVFTSSERVDTQTSVIQSSRSTLSSESIQERSERLERLMEAKQDFFERIMNTFETVKSFSERFIASYTSKSDRSDSYSSVMDRSRTDSSSITFDRDRSKEYQLWVESTRNDNTTTHRENLSSEAKEVDHHLIEREAVTERLPNLGDVSLDGLADIVQQMVQTVQKPTSEVQKVEHVVSSTIDVNLNVTGDGAQQLNQATAAQLEQLVRRIVAENEKLRLSMNPMLLK